MAGMIPACPRSRAYVAERVGVAKRDNVIDVAVLEHSIREDLNRTAWRVMAVINPVKLIITNYPEGQEEMLTTENNPEDPNAGTREVPFSRELFIEREDFMVVTNKQVKYQRFTAPTTPKVAAADQAAAGK